MSSRGRGLALDWLESATVVLPNASLVVCSETKNPDLFWGLRGAGSNFGVVSSFKFRTFAAPSVATAFLIELDWTGMQEMMDGMDRLRDWAEMQMPPELNFRLVIESFGSPPSPSLQGIYYGSASELNNTLAGLSSTINGTFTVQSTAGWLKTLEFFSDGISQDQTYPYTEVCKTCTARYFLDSNQRLYYSMTRSTPQVCLSRPWKLDLCPDSCTTGTKQP